MKKTDYINIFSEIETILGLTKRGYFLSAGCSEQNSKQVNNELDGASEISNSGNFSEPVYELQADFRL